MSSQTQSGHKSFALAASQTILTGQRVQLDSSGNLLLASNDDSWIGVAEADGDTNATAGTASTTISVRLRNDAGTFWFMASAAVTANALLYTAASGKVASTGTTKLGFRAIEAATADGDIIECCPTGPSATS